MAEINNVIAEASQDLQTIEDFVNLPADSEVYPRLLPSVNVGTLAGTRDAIFEAGGLPAKPFATKALMTASALVDGDYAMVTDDAVNNGLYLKTAGAWVKSAYDPLSSAKSYTDENAGKNRGLTISTYITLDFTTNTLTGGGGFITQGDVYITAIPASQSITLEPASETAPAGNRKLAIHKTTKLFAIFNSNATVTSDYITLGHITGRRWYSFATDGATQVKIINKTDSGKTVSDVPTIPLLGNIEVTSGAITINTEASTVQLSSVVLFSKYYRGGVTNKTVTYTGALTAIAYDVNTKTVEILSGTDMFSPSHLVIAYVAQGKMHTSSSTQHFRFAGANTPLLVIGKPNVTQSTTEPMFLDADADITINFQSKTISSTKNGYGLANKFLYPIRAAQDSAFTTTSTAAIHYVTYDIATAKLSVKLYTATKIVFDANEPLIGYINGYKFYGFGDNIKRIKIINESGVEVPQQAGGDTTLPVFNDQTQRALLPNKLFFINDRVLPIYKDSVFSAPQNGLETVRAWIDTNNAETIKRYLPITEQAMLDPTDITATAKFVYAHSSVADKRYWKDIAIAKAPATNVAKPLTMLCIGDSLTQDATPFTLKNKLDVLGSTVTSVGTFSSSETPNELPSEGRGYWSYRNFIGKDNRSTVAHTRSAGGKTATAKFENPFLKLATTQDKTDNPTWCFRFTGANKELSYADDPVKTGDFYIFDYSWYSVQHSVATPDFITIGLGTNDINLDLSVYSQAEALSFMTLGLEIMVKQINKVLPTVKIGVIPSPAWSATDKGYSAFSDTTSIWIERCIKKVSELKATHANLEVIPAYLHMNRDMGYNIVNSANLNADSNVQSGVITDWVHYNQVGRDQYAEAVIAWLANVI